MLVSFNPAVTISSNFQAKNQPLDTIYDALKFTDKQQTQQAMQSAYNASTGFAAKIVQIRAGKRGIKLNTSK